jgi:hypothetical protein
VRLSAPPGAFGADQGSRNPVEPSPASRKRKRSPSDTRRDQRRAARNTVNAIDETAHERHEAYLEGGQPNTTYRLTRKLDELFDERRDETAGTLTDPFYGSTMRAGKGSK